MLNLNAIKLKVAAWAERWLFSTNHKDIGSLYLIFGLLSGVINTVLLIAIKLELAKSCSQILYENHKIYNGAIIAYTFIMLFVMTLFILMVGFGNGFIFIYTSIFTVVKKVCEFIKPHLVYQDKETASKISLAFFYFGVTISCLHYRVIDSVGVMVDNPVFFNVINSTAKATFILTMSYWLPSLLGVFLQSKIFTVVTLFVISRVGEPIKIILSTTGYEDYSIHRIGIHIFRQFKPDEKVDILTQWNEFFYKLTGKGPLNLNELLSLVNKATNKDLQKGVENLYATLPEPKLVTAVEVSKKAIEADVFSWGETLLYTGQYFLIGCGVAVLCFVVYVVLTESGKTSSVKATSARVPISGYSDKKLDTEYNNYQKLWRNKYAEYRGVNSSKTKALNAIAEQAQSVYCENKTEVGLLALKKIIQVLGVFK